MRDFGPGSWIFKHFNLPGHSLCDMHITALEHVQNADEAFRKVREKMYIRLGNTKLKGMNKVSWTANSR